MELSILQWNIWLLKILGFDYTRNLPLRLEKIYKKIEELNTDIISFEEVWGDQDKRVLISALEKTYPYHGYQPSPWYSMGDGLLFFSKFPILSKTNSTPFRPPTRLQEWLTHKRVVKWEVEVPSVGRVDFFQTHMGSTLFHPEKMHHHAGTKTRLLQQIQTLSSFIHEKYSSKYSFLIGDLNFHYQAHEPGTLSFRPEFSPEYQLLNQGLEKLNIGLIDTFLEFHGKEPHHTALATYSQSNPLVSKGDYSNYPDETLDYIFYPKKSGVQVLDARVIDDHDLSDHYGLLGRFRFPV